MSDTTMKSSNKRYLSSRQTGPQHKRRRSNKKPQPTDTTINQSLTKSEPTKITDLNDQCLEMIFKRLTAQELLNVAVANKWLNASAGPIFRQMFGQKLVQLTSIAVCRSQIFVTGQIVLVSGLKNCLQLLRCFGPYTTKLSIQFGDSTQKCAKLVNQYVNEYCHETLVHVAYHGATEYSTHCIQKPYSNVKSVYITESRWIKNLPQFTNWFPNLHRLELVFNAFNPKCADAHFPNLHELRLFLIGQYRLRDNLLKYLTRLFQKNPHIKSLEMDVQAEPATKELLNFRNFLASLNGNSAISTLRTTYGFGFVGLQSSNLFELTRRFPSLTEIDLKPYRFSSEDVICFVRQQKELKYFRFTIDKPSKIKDLQMRLDDEWQSTVLVDKWQSNIVSLKRR